MGQIEPSEGYPVGLGGELRSPFGINESRSAAREMALGRLDRRQAMIQDLNHVAGSQVKEGAGELARARGDIGEGTRLGRRAGQVITDHHAVAAKVNGTIPEESAPGKYRREALVFHCLVQKGCTVEAIRLPGIGPS